MGRVKPGDTIAIKDPKRHSLVKAGKLILQAPEVMSTKVPDNISTPDLRVLDNLVDWGVILVSEEPLCLFHQEHDPLLAELSAEYETLKAQEAVDFIKKLSQSNMKKFLDYERVHKNRATVIRAFPNADFA